MQMLLITIAASAMTGGGPAPRPTGTPISRPKLESVRLDENTRAAEHRRDQIKAVIRTARKRGELSRKDANALLRHARRVRIDEFAQLEIRIASRRSPADSSR